MYIICKHVNFMFQFGIIIDYLFTFQKKKKFFFFKIPSFWVFTQASGKYLGKYPKNIYLPTGYLPTPHHYACVFKFKCILCILSMHICTYMPYILSLEIANKCAHTATSLNVYVCVFKSK